MQGEVTCVAVGGCVGVRAWYSSTCLTCGYSIKTRGWGCSCALDQHIKKNICQGTLQLVSSLLPAQYYHN